jgi:hypothetical protein
VTWVMSNLASIHLEMVLCRCKIAAWFAPNVPLAQKSFWTHLMERLGNVGHGDSRFGLFENCVSVGAK